MNRCQICRCKLPLTAFKCKCSNYYCPVHMDSNAHECKYKYHAEEQKRLETLLCRLSPLKIEKI
tara:strand:+ start:1256 stop:1447 length:192 start_codon:yes stop_codon:yes gene_type:complete